jgi:DNA-binding SARP family transcriptional activator
MPVEPAREPRCTSRCGTAPIPDISQPYRVDLLGSLRVSRGQSTLSLKSREQRLIALLAVNGTRPRAYLAGRLWPDTTDARAAASLRAAVCRVERGAPGLLRGGDGHLGLEPGTVVDIHEVVSRAEALCRAVAAAGAEQPGDDWCLQSLTLLLRGELLSGWYDEWVSDERERLQSLRLGALEAVAEILRVRGQHAAALSAALGATGIEPLRESAHRALIRIYLDDGNFHAALRAYGSFGRRMLAELGVRPSPQLDALVRPLLQHRAPPPRSAVGGRAGLRPRPVAVGG